MDNKYSIYLNSLQNEPNNAQKLIIVKIFHIKDKI